MTDPNQKPQHHGQEIAGIGARAFAFTVDLHIRLVIAVLWIGIASFVLPYLDINFEYYLVLTFGPATLFYLLYHPLVELMMDGDSPGKRYAEVELITQTGDKPGKRAILIRNIWRIVDSLPFGYLVGIVVCVKDAQYRRLGDQFASTLLVYKTTKT